MTGKHALHIGAAGEELLTLLRDKVKHLESELWHSQQLVKVKCEKENELTDKIRELEDRERISISYTGSRICELENALELAEKRIAELEARPANPINFKENADADYCRGWAWNEVKKELASEAWTVGDNCTFYGFFCWGWDSRRQFNEQRGAGITVKGDIE